jgi:lipoprotein-releasing system ATP-binding protein
LHIQKEIVSIAAGNTLLQILGTLDKPSPENEIMLRINDQDILTMNDKNLSKFKIKLGFIFQFHQLLPEFTALENVCIPAFIANKSKHETEIEGEKLLDYLGLPQSESQTNELSGGEQQRVAVARP